MMRRKGRRTHYLPLVLSLMMFLMLLCLPSSTFLSSSALSSPLLATASFSCSLVSIFVPIIYVDGQEQDGGLGGGGDRRSTLATTGSTSVNQNQNPNNRNGNSVLVPVTFNPNHPTTKEEEAEGRGGDDYSNKLQHGHTDTINYDASSPPPSSSSSGSFGRIPRRLLLLSIVVKIK